jgi:hypothetical protein
MVVRKIAQLLIETAKNNGAFDVIAPTDDWWNWYAAYSDARERGSMPAEASAAAGRHMAHA